MSNSLRAKARRTVRSHLSKYQRGIMASQHFGDEYAQHNAEVRGRGDSRLKELMEEVTSGRAD